MKRTLYGIAALLLVGCGARTTLYGEDPTADSGADTSVDATTHDTGLADTGPADIGHGDVGLVDTRQDDTSTTDAGCTSFAECPIGEACGTTTRPARPLARRLRYATAAAAMRARALPGPRRPHAGRTLRAARAWGASRAPRACRAACAAAKSRPIAPLTRLATQRPMLARPRAHRASPAMAAAAAALRASPARASAPAVGAARHASPAVLRPTAAPRWVPVPAAAGPRAGRARFVRAEPASVCRP